ncbi:MAG: PLP-dependent aminotransferase family protein, partial [Candidatus Limnocylindria bacterium]
VYEQRHECIADVLRTSMADELDLIPSSVGLHLAAEARRWSVAWVADGLRRASRSGVEALSLAQFAVDEAPRSGIVLGYGAIGVEQIDEGLARLARSLRA